MARQFGIITTVSGLSAGFCVNDLTFDQSVETAEARNEKGEVTDLTAYSRTTSLSASGVLDTDTGTLVRAGDKLTLDSKDYIIESVSKTESSTAFVTISVTARGADSAIITPITESESSGSSDSSSSV